MTNDEQKQLIEEHRLALRAEDHAAIACAVALSHIATYGNEITDFGRNAAARWEAAVAARKEVSARLFGPKVSA